MGKKAYCKTYWDSKNHTGVEIGEFLGKRYVNCFLDEDSWLDSRIGNRKRYRDVVFCLDEVNILERNIVNKLVDDLKHRKHIPLYGRDYNIEQIFKVLNAWNGLIDSEISI